LRGDAVNQWAIKNIGLIDDYKVLPDPEEEKKESPGKELLYRANKFIDKAANQFDKAVRFFKS
jgi:hypothetical protein